MLISLAHRCRDQIALAAVTAILALGAVTIANQVAGGHNAQPAGMNATAASVDTSSTTAGVFGWD